MANFYVTSTGETTISTIVDGLSTTHGRVREFNWYANNVFKGKSFTEPYTGSKVHTFTSLSPNTFYNLKVVIIDTKVPPEFEVTLTTSGTTDERIVLIDKFYWTSSEINAFNNNGTLDTISYLRWNTFCDKIQEVLSEGNNSWDTTWGSLTATKMSSSDKELTADRFNAARYNIGSHYSTGISTVSTGDIIYGSYFITLQNSLNNWIDTL